MNDIKYRATRRAGNSTCRVMEYQDGQTWVASEQEGAWWRTPHDLANVERILADATPAERVLDVMRKIVPHYNPYLDTAARPSLLAGGFLRGMPRVLTQRGWSAPRVKAG